MDELAAIPGIGDRTAGDIVVNRPYESVADAALGTEFDLTQFMTTRPLERAD